ncbi:efflux RND transporter permease subunit [bacterium AH-315-M10]|nr:efflux RND transporter permease subunit [bacterium AH-315-M10]
MIRAFAHHPTAANLLMLAIVLLGLLGAMQMNRQVFPEFDPGFVAVRVVYRGASAEDVEERVCQLIEQAVEGIEGVERTRSTSREGVCEMRVTVADGHAPGEVMRDIQNAVDQIDNFPENAEDPLIWEVKKQAPVLTVSMIAEMPDKDLLALAEQLKDELMALDGVSQVNLQGFSQHQIKVEVDREQLEAHKLTIHDVARQIQNQSLDLPAGSVETDERELNIRILDQRRFASAFRKVTIISSSGGARVPLGAIAKVRDSFEAPWQRARFNRKPCVNLEVTKTQSEDTISIAETIQEFLARRQQTLPPGVELVAWGDWSKPVKERLMMLIENGAIGFVLVFLVLWTFLNFRLAFWVALGIPVSFMGTLFILDSLGMTLDMVSMFSLIIALGIVVDDAIVLGENVYAHHGRGKPALLAAVDGTRQVSVGVMASMLTTIAVFFPLMTMKGEIGKVLRVMPFGVIAALSVSLLEGFLVLPHHLAHSLPDEPSPPNRLRAAIDRGLAWFIEVVYGRTLAWCVTHRAITISCVVSLLLISVGQLAGGRLNFTPFPKVDGDVVVCRILLPHGTPPGRTAKVVARVEAALDTVNAHFKSQQPGGQDLLLYSSTVFGFNREADEAGSHVATIAVELLGADVRKTTCDQMMNRWREAVGEVADVVSVTYAQLQVTPGGKAIEIQLVGKQLSDLKLSSVALQNKLREYPGIRNLTDDLRPGNQELRVQLKPSAISLGISSASLAQQLRAAFWGDPAQEFQRGGDSVEVRVRLDPRHRRSIADLEAFKVLTPTGQQVPLLEVADLALRRGYGKIVRVDGRRTVSISADVDPEQGNADKILASLERNYFSGFLGEHPGISLSLEGQRKDTGKTRDSVLRGFAIGLAVVYLLLALIFKSYVEPLIVMAAIPFGLIGAIWGHKLMGLDWTMPSMVGFVSLAGIVVNDSIVLLEFIKRELAAGAGLHDSILQGCKDRFRAVFLTSATTVAGLTPILLEKSMQAQFLIPMACSIAFGMLFATVLVLLLVPTLYCLIRGRCRPGGVTAH